MAMTFTQTDNSAAGTCIPTEVASCGGAGTQNYSGIRHAVVGGTAGTAAHGLNVSGSASGQYIWSYLCDLSGSVSWDAGTWTVRFNVTTANMNITVSRIDICRHGSDCTSLETLGSATGLAISMGSTGVKSQTVSGSAATSPGATDLLVISFQCDNASMNLAVATLTPNADIDSPFTAITQSLLWDTGSAMRPHLVRKVRELFLGGLPPKFAKLRMVLNDAGLYVPANDPELARSRAQLAKAA